MFLDDRRHPSRPSRPNALNTGRGLSSEKRSTIAGRVNMIGYSAPSQASGISSSSSFDDDDAGRRPPPRRRPFFSVANDEPNDDDEPARAERASVMMSSRRRPLRSTAHRNWVSRSSVRSRWAIPMLSARFFRPARTSSKSRWTSGVATSAAPVVSISMGFVSLRRKNEGSFIILKRNYLEKKLEKKTSVKKISKSRLGMIKRPTT